MRKRITFVMVLVATMLLFVPSQVLGQSKYGKLDSSKRTSIYDKKDASVQQQNEEKPLVKMRQVRQSTKNVRTQKALRKVKGGQAPAVNLKAAPVKGKKTITPFAPVKVAKKGGKSVLTVANHTQLIVNVVYDASEEDNFSGYLGGVNPALRDANFDAALNIGYDFSFNSGAAIIDGMPWGAKNVYVGVSAPVGYGQAAEPQPARAYVYDIESWDLLTDFYLGYSPYDYGKVALETATAKDGTVYGQFYNSDGSDVIYGKIDYVTQELTPIAVAKKHMVVMGVTKDNKLYGVAKDGNLYEVNTATGEETLVGATGVDDIANSYGMFYVQTGEIDWRDDTFYWIDAPYTDGNVNSLYTIDLKTGKATKIFEFDYYFECVGMAIVPAERPDGTPEAVDGLSVSFEGQNTRGQIEFTAPTHTYDGKELKADTKLFYHVFVTNNVVTDQEIKLENNYTLPGKTVAIAVEDPAIKNDAENIFSITVNIEGESEQSVAATRTVWLGHGIPGAPKNVTASVSKATKKATVTWEQPEAKGVKGGIVNQADLKYNVYMIADGGAPVQVGTNLSVDSKGSGKFEQALADAVFTGDLAVYVFGVEAVNNGNAELTSDMALSDGTELGTGKSIPYIADMTGDFAKFIIIDANNDGLTWNYDGYNDEVWCDYNPYGFVDDWLILEGMELKKDKSYSLQVVGRTLANYGYPERLEVRVGTGKTVDDMTIGAVPPTDLTTADYAVKGQFSVSADGNYWVGIHAISDPDMGYIMVDELSVTEGGISENAPDAATGAITVDPVFSMMPQAKYTVTAPTKTMKGEDLKNSQHMTIDVYCNGNIVRSFDNVRKGEQVSGDYMGVASGESTFSAIATLDGEASDLIQATAVYLGWDNAVLAPTGVRGKQMESALVLTWDEVETTPDATGMNVYVGANKAWLPVLGHAAWDENGNPVVSGGASFTADKNITVALEDPNEGPADYRYYDVAALSMSADGNFFYSPRVPIYIYTGSPNALPWYVPVNSLDNMGHYFWYTMDQDLADVNAYYQVYYGLTVAGLAAADDLNGNEGYSYDVYSYLNGQITIEFDKASLKGAVKPILEFDYFNESDEVKAIVSVEKPNGETVVIAEEGSTDDVTHLSYDLSEFRGLDFVRLRITTDVNMEDQGNLVETLYDNFLIYDASATKNLAVVDVQAPEQLTAGKSAPVYVTVLNAGQENATAYTVSLKDNGIVVAEQTLDVTLAPLESKIVELDYVATTVSANESTTAVVKAVAGAVEMEGDQVEADNEMATSVYVNVLGETATSAPFAVRAEEAEDGSSVNVVWNFTADAQETVVEGFDDTDLYPVFSTGNVKAGQQKGALGDWKLFDGDGKTTYSWEGATDYIENVYEPQAYQVFDPTGLLGNMDARSGSQYLVSMDPADGNYLAAADDYLISPEVNGGSVIEFYYRTIQGNPESFEVLYSEDTQDVEDFKDNVVATYTDVTVTDWARAYASIPSEARYFAIHHNGGTPFSFGLMIDDVTYYKGATVDHFNIYVDGVLVGEVDGETLTFTTETGFVPGDHQVAVTAVYADGTESAPAYATFTTAINNVLNSNEPFDVYSVDGKLVRQQTTSVAGLKGVYVINSKKVVLK